MLNRYRVQQDATVGLALGWLAVTVAALLAPRLGLPPRAGLQAIAAFATLHGFIHYGLPLLRLRRFGWANSVTLARGVLVALLVGLIGVAEVSYGGWPWLMLLAATLALVLDGVDGWLARRYRSVSAFGARFDMETDAALVLVLAVLVWQLDKADVWVLLIGALRYGFIAAGWLWLALRRPLPPSQRRRALCAVQVGALIIALCPLLAKTLTAPLLALTGGLLVLSFAIDIAWQLRRAD